MPGVVGARVRCHGRFTRRQRADRATHKWGRLGRTHLGARVEDARTGAALRFGAVGVTLLVNYGGDA
jgi:ribosomal protein S3